ncbi:MAG TPA: acyltransferase [Telluria sp.]|nr:acyltransferase [Telluria sp.]
MSATSHLQYLDGWRGLAILFLLAGHFFPVPGINFGAIGVSLFFVLSGLLMSDLLFVRQVPLPQFYQRRISRILPAALVFLCLIVGGRLLLGQRVAWNEVAAAALFVNNYTVGATGAEAMPFGHFWSLCVEEHSYILLSLLAIAARRHLARAGTLVTAAALAAGATGIIYCLLFKDTELRHLSMHSEMASFGILSSAALALALRGRNLPRLAAFACPPLLLLGIALHWWSMPPVLNHVMSVAAFALAINLLAAAPAALQTLLAALPLRQLGLWSFSIYVWQQPFYLLSKYQGMPAALGVTLALGCGIASFYLVEQPSRTWLNRRFSRPQPAAATVAAPGIPAAGDAA